MRKIYFVLSLFIFLQSAGAGFNTRTDHAGNHVFASDVIQPADVTVCSGALTNTITFTSNFPGTTFSWVNSDPTIGLAANGTGNIAAFTATNATSGPLVATITVTPSDGVTNGTPRSFTITINPVPTVDPVPGQTLCSNNNTTSINFSGPVPNTIYTWTNTNPSIGLAASGSGNISSFNVTNTTGTPITATVTVTPIFGSIAPELLYYKFDGAGTSVPNLASNPPVGTNNATIVGAYTQGGAGVCGGMLQSNGVSVNDYLNTNWSPSVNGSWTISFIVSGFSGATNGTIYDLFGSMNGTTPFRATYTEPLPGSSGLGRIDLYKSGNVISAEANFTTPKTVTFAYNHSTQILTSYVNGGAQSGSAGNWSINLPSFYIGNVFNGTGGSPSAGSSIDEFRMYNRRLSATEIQGLTNSCTITGGCAGVSETFDITVLPRPIVDTLTSQALCTNTQTADIIFTSNVAGTTYNWTNDNTSIGLAASGTGDILSFTATNNGSTIEMATITVTSVAPGIPACSGTQETFTISVSPVPTASINIASQTLCSEGPIAQIIPTSPVPITVFNWTRDKLTEVTGIPASGTGTISGLVSNTTTLQQTITFTITPSIGGCIGTPITATVTVDPVPVATTTPASQTICSGAIADIIHSSNMPGAIFSWSRDNTVDVTGIPANGTGDISGSLVNTTTTPITVTFTITPSINGCSGQAIFATVLVNAVPTILCPANIITNNAAGVCGATVNYTTTVTGAPAPTLTFSFTGATIGTGSGNGSGSVFNVGVTTVSVTATNTCGSANCSFTITANDTQNPTISCPSNILANTNAGVCTANVATPNPISLDNCSVTEQTWTLSGATTASSASTGINNVGTRIFNKGLTTVTYIIKDAAGNSATCSYTVTVSDVELPVIVCASNITVTSPIASCVATVNYTITATDNCPGVTTQLVAGPASGSAFPIGTTTVTWKATDAANNTSANCSFTVTVIDGQLPVISSHPVTKTVCAGTSTNFTVTATNVLNYQWQQWTGLVWSNIAGANTATYTIGNPTISMNTNTFRVVLTGLCSVVNSNAATLYVNPLPSISLNAAPYSSILPSQQTTLTAIVNPGGGTFAWTFNNNPLTGVTGPVVSSITAEGIGTYSTVYTDSKGCKVTSDQYTISGMPSDNMWVYPNPNKGLFDIRYYNQVNEPATVMVFSPLGQLIYQRALITRLNYSSITIDFTHTAYSAGIYIVKVISSIGRELAAKRVMVER